MQVLFPSMSTKNHLSFKENKQKKTMCNLRNSIVVSPLTMNPSVYSISHALALTHKCINTHTHIYAHTLSLSLSLSCSTTSTHPHSHTPSLTHTLMHTLKLTKETGVCGLYVRKTASEGFCQRLKEGFSSEMCICWPRYFLQARKHARLSSERTGCGGLCFSHIDLPVISNALKVPCGLHVVMIKHATGSAGSV